MKKSLGLLFAGALATVALITGCNSNSNNGAPPGFGTNCGPPPNGFQILYPRNNAPRVPPGQANAIYVAAKPPLVVGNSYNFFVSQSNGNQQFSSTFATFNGQIPTPHNSPVPGSKIYVANIVVSPIGPSQSVNLLWNDGGTGCTPNAIVSTYTTGQ